MQNKFVLTTSEKLGEQQMFGVELEYEFAPDTTRIACIAYLMKENMLTYEDLRTQSRSTIGKLSILQMEDMKVDGSNDELILYPMTLSAAKNLKPHIDIMFQSLKQWSYEPWSPMGEIGMHISVERSMITAEALRKIFNWLLANNAIFIYLSGRKNWGTIRADIQYQLGDKYRKWSKEELRRQADEQFEISVSAFQKYFNSDICGIRTYLNRPYIQFTQFASTTKSEELLSKIEFMDWLLNWCADKEDNDPHHFIESVQASKYPYLHDTLKSLNI